ncbi:MAG: LCP family protein [Clostridia bacterium]|nr:LCP family protein [Clostridia bacterium]
MAKDKRRKTAGKTRRPTPRGKRLIWFTVAVCCVLLVIFGIVLVNAVKNSAGQKDASESDVNAYDTTPVSLQKKVAYYVVGLLGEEETSPTSALFLLCHDKKQKILNVLEVPQATYLGDSDLWIEKKAGNVWGNPAPLDWCDFEGKRIYKAQIAECEEQGHTVSQKIGSASYNLISIFNEQYALPVDGYFMIPQEAFIKLVDLLGGLDVHLESAVTLGEIKFSAGVKTLDGAGALEYITMGGNTVDADLKRIQRQRRVFFALFQRLCAQSEEQLTKDSLLPVMKGSTPLRTRTSNDDMLAIINAWKDISADNVTAMILPGQAATLEGVSYYSVHRQQLIEVLNTYFNPYGEEITEAHVQIAEISSGGNSDTKLQTMDQIAVEQGGIAEDDKDK